LDAVRRCDHIRNQMATTASRRVARHNSRARPKQMHTFEISVKGNIFEVKAHTPEAAIVEAYRRGFLPPEEKAYYEEAQRRGWLHARCGKIAVNPDTGELLYLDREVKEWKQALAFVIPKTRELFGFTGDEWQKITAEGPGIKRRIQQALRGNADTAEAHKEWGTLEFTGNWPPAVKGSNDFGSLPPDEGRS